jgi:hypothetical protein
MTDNLSGRQLNAASEVVFANQKRIGGSNKIPEEGKKEEEATNRKSSSTEAYVDTVRHNGYLVFLSGT